MYRRLIFVQNEKYWNYVQDIKDVVDGDDDGVIQEKNVIEYENYLLHQFEMIHDGDIKHCIYN